MDLNSSVEWCSITERVCRKRITNTGQHRTADRDRLHCSGVLHLLTILLKLETPMNIVWKRSTLGCSG